MKALQKSLSSMIFPIFWGDQKLYLLLNQSNLQQFDKSSSIYEIIVKKSLLFLQDTALVDVS